MLSDQQTIKERHLHKTWPLLESARGLNDGGNGAAYILETVWHFIGRVILENWGGGAFALFFIIALLLRYQPVFWGGTLRTLLP